MNKGAKYAQDSIKSEELGERWDHNNGQEYGNGSNQIVFNSDSRKASTKSEESTK